MLVIKVDKSSGDRNGKLMLFQCVCAHTSSGTLTYAGMKSVLHLGYPSQKKPGLATAITKLQTSCD